MLKSKWIMLIMLSVTMVLSGNLLAESRKEAGAVDKNMKTLNSSDKNVRRRAIGELYRMHERGEVNRTSPGLSKMALRKYASRWDEDSDKAVLLLGAYGGTNDIPAIRRLMNDAEEIKGNMDDRKVLVPRMKLACLKALLKLNDTNAVKKVQGLLKADDVASRVLAVDCVRFAQKRDLIQEVLALLPDTRDAVNIAPSGGEYYLRICDIALNAVASIAKVKVSFTVQHGERYSEQMISEFRAKVNASE